MTVERKRGGIWRPGVVLTLSLACGGEAVAQEKSGPAPPSSTSRVERPEEKILRALATNPVTAPFVFQVVRRNGQYALSGRVGSSGIHDAAIQTALSLGYPVRDDLVIDTGLMKGVVGPLPPLGVGPQPVYPPSLLGRLDLPFLGIDPPLVRFPPFFVGEPRRDLLNPPVPVAGGPAQPISSGSVELTLDVRGVAMLKGTVATPEDRDAIVREVASVPGIVQVVNLLEVVGPDESPADQPPPPPQPIGAVPAPPDPDRPDAKAIEPADGLAAQVSEAIGRRPATAGLGLRVSSRQGVVTLEGRVPSVYEAMLAYRAAQQTPGVRDVEDQMTFDLPEEGRPSPLARKGRPQDIEPYLMAHLRRQLGDLAHVDQVRVRGDTLEVVGTVTREDDSQRVEAALRSIPLLRGFRLEPRFLRD